jgi:hypothetical protein
LLLVFRQIRRQTAGNYNNLNYTIVIVKEKVLGRERII